MAQLSRKTIASSDAAHLGSGGYFIFEAIEGPLSSGICVLSKAASIDAALRLADLISGGAFSLAKNVANTLSNSG